MAGESIEIPLGCNDMHHEIELGVVINQTCKRIDADNAMKYVGGYCLALDMTARDFQVFLKKIAVEVLHMNPRMKQRRRDPLGLWQRCLILVFQ